MPASFAAARASSRLPLHHRVRAALLTLALLLPALVGAPPVARAASCVVTDGGDSGANTLRGHLASPTCDTITFAAGVTTVSVTTYLTIARAVTIQGPGAGALTIRHTGASAANGNVFSISGGTVTLRGLTVTGGRSTGSWGAGLSIAGIPAPATVTLDGVTVTDNIATNAGGGGIYASNATLTLLDSTVSANQAVGAFNARAYPQLW